MGVELNKKSLVSMVNMQKGFTIIELMITIGIVGIISVMVIPSFKNFVAKQKLEGTSRSLVMTFSEARAQAVTLRRTVDVRPVAPVVGTDSNAVLFWQPKYSDIQLINGTEAVAFNENGLATRTRLVAGVATQIPLNFVLCSSVLGTSKTIVLSRTGVVESIQDSGAC